MQNNLTGKYTIFVCLNDCNDNQLNYSSNNIYEFKQGLIYGTSHTPWFPTQKNNIYIENNLYNSGSFKGLVSAQFLAKNFIIRDDYRKYLIELDKVFEEIIQN